MYYNYRLKQHSNLFDIKDLNFVIAGGLGQVGLN